MTVSYNILPATDYVSAIAELDIQIFPEVCWGSRTIAQELQRGFGLVCCVDDISEQAVVGFTMVNCSQTIADITRLGVLTTHQGQRIGSQLLQRALDTAALTHKSVMLTVRKSNLGAIKLYRAHGFQITSELAVGAWAMTRNL